MRFTEVPVHNTAASSWEDSYDTLWDAAAAVPEDELGREYDFPYGGPGRRHTLAGLLANFLHEHVHDGAEILCLRDLYRVERTS